MGNWSDHLVRSSLRGVWRDSRNIDTRIGSVRLEHVETDKFSPARRIAGTDGADVVQQVPMSLYVGLGYDTPRGAGRSDDPMEGE